MSHGTIYGSSNMSHGTSYVTSNMSHGTIYYSTNILAILLNNSMYMLAAVICGIVHEVVCIVQQAMGHPRHKAHGTSQLSMGDHYVSEHDVPTLILIC